MDLKNFYNHINVCLDTVTRLREDLLLAYHFIKRHSEFEEYFVPDCSHYHYSWNYQAQTYLRHSLLVAFNNDTCVISSMAPQAYKVLNTHAHEISGCTIVSILIHSRAPHIGGMSGYVQSDLSTLTLQNREKLVDFIAELSYFNRKLSSLEKLYLLQDFSSST